MDGRKHTWLTICHQYPVSSDKVSILEHEKINSQANIVGSDKRIGVRQVGVWNNDDYARHLYLFVDFKGDNNWEQVIHWIDRGQYTALVKKTVKGPFKSPPPYRDYPYGEDDALTRIKLIGDIDVHSTWCRQINPKSDKFKKEEKDEPMLTLVSRKETIDNEKLLWSSDDTLKHDNIKVIPGTYANADVANTILFAATADPNAMFGIKDGDAIWSGTDSRWYINHHVIDSEVINSSIEFDMLMGGADEIRIQLGNRGAMGWILDNDYVFGGYEFIINRDGKVYARIEYYYSVNEAGRSSSAYSIAEHLGDIEFDPQNEVHMSVGFKNTEKKQVMGSLFMMTPQTRVPRALFKTWKQKDWIVPRDEVPHGRVDSSLVKEGLYLAPKHHWSVQRIRTTNRVDNGSLIKSIKVYKL